MSVTKRALDLTLAFFALFLIMPLWLVTALLIRIETRGAIIFRQERVGRNQETFKVYKFRTMIEGAQTVGTGLFSYDNDPRITRVGRKLRQWSIDETPQLINIIIGNMSLVGPRPPVFGELDAEHSLPEGYENRFKVLPGVTGLAQISGRNSLNWKDKIEFDLAYIDKFKTFGVILDIMIIIKTIFIVIAQKNVVEKEKMIISYDQLQKISEEYGNSFYTFDREQLKENIETFRKHFKQNYPKVEVAYSYKTNYIPSLLKIIDSMKVTAEVVSEMEYDLARSIGVNLQEIIYNGPVKNRASLSKAILNQSRINIDSMDELSLILEVLTENQVESLEIGIRCNFGADYGSISRFGIDVKSKEFEKAIQIINDSRILHLAGLHCHLPDRDLDSVVWRTNQLLETSLKTFKNSPKFLDFGGGFFGSDFATPREDAVTFEDYARVITSLVKTAYPNPHDQPWIILEPGTALVANTMNYWTCVVAVKRIESRSIAVVDGSIHELSPNGRQLRNPTFHVRKNSITQKHSEIWDVVGYTCIEDDYLSKDYLAEVSKDDFLGYSHVGSYNVVMKPPFIRPASAVLELDRNGEILNVLREIQTIGDIFSGFRNQN
jgi:diaminopimelate decarboxylase